MMARWKAAGCDLVKMMMRDRVIRRKTEELKKKWLWITRDELLKRFNNNTALVDELIHVKRRNGQVRENPDAPGVKSMVQFKILAEQSETECEVKMWEQELEWDTN